MLLRIYTVRPVKTGFDEGDLVLVIFCLVITLITFMLMRRYKVLSELRSFFNRQEKLSIENFTLGFENIEFNNKLPAKKVSGLTKIVLTVFVLTFIFTPFSYFLPTLEYSNYFYGDVINTLFY